MPPELSLVIPTHNGRRVLPAVLEALESQQDSPSFEVVVVDDGSTDGTLSWLEGRPTALELRVMSQRRQGPAAARNAGVEAARAPTVAFLGDDTVPAADWLAAHWRARERRGAGSHLAIVGYTTLHPRIRETPFVRWLYREGWQFGYGLIEDPEDLPFNLLYTSNLSLPRRALLEEPFDTGFPDAAWEDTELGYRLRQKGLRIVFERSARVMHDHPTSLRLFCRRQERAGYGAVVFLRRHPELSDFLGFGADGPPAPPPRLGHLARTLIARLLEPLPLDLPATWDRVLYYHYARGAERGWRDFADAPS